MPVETLRAEKAGHAAVPYVLPFAAFGVFLALQHWLPPASHADAVLRTVALTAVIAISSRGAMPKKLMRPAMSIWLGVAVFAVWIAPDVLFPAYRQNWLFQNALLGTLNNKFTGPLPPGPLLLTLRSFRAAILVPIVEELFWRGWLMRWLINPRFERVPLGTWSASAFWITALLFASEHGPYWDVGLLAGVIYNWWMVRTRSLGDCMLSHGVTNLCLSLYVIATGQWQYWM